MNDKNFQNYKNIIKKHGYNLSDAEIYNIVKNISELAAVLLSFERGKKKKPKDAKPP